MYRWRWQCLRYRWEVQMYLISIWTEYRYRFQQPQITLLPALCPFCLDCVCVFVISLIACDRLVQRGVFKRRQCPSVVLEPTRRRRPTASPTTDQCSCDSQPREALCSHQKCSHQKCSHRKCSHERLPPKVLEVSNCRCDKSSNDLKKTVSHIMNCDRRKPGQQV